MQSENIWGLPGGPVVKTSPSNAEAMGSMSGWAAKIPHATGPKHKQKQYFNKFNTDFKNDPYQKKKKSKVLSPLESRSSTCY